MSGPSAWREVLDSILGTSQEGLRDFKAASHQHRDPSSLPDGLVDIDICLGRSYVVIKLLAALATALRPLRSASFVV